MRPYLFPKEAKVGKYGNKKTEYAGRLYDSKKEAQHAQFLNMCMTAVDQAQKVTKWEAQVAYPIVVNGEKICSYLADFRVEYADGHVEVQDVKSEETRKIATYRLKKKLVHACHGVTIIEI